MLDSSASESARPEPPHIADALPPNVLIVDDRPLSLLALQEVLKRHPAADAIATAKNAAQGLELLRAEKPGVAASRIRILLADERSDLTNEFTKISEQPRIGNLSRRQLEILTPLAVGQRNKIIVDQLQISVKTVEAHARA